MSTQALDPGITLCVSHRQYLYKIIELPNELLDALEAETPPMLILKSNTTSTDNSLNYNIKQNTAILCHGSHKYSLRSKNTSNPNILLKSSEISTVNNLEKPSDLPPSPSLTVVAQCQETIELVLLNENQDMEVRKVKKWHEMFSRTQPSKRS
ncbi:BgTH12-04736 [Blumeria graminis f. sp. triticale]|uniref:Bgt-5487 n=3 Tax=Blumeria graminis TaxID=34373 RepID=A0A381L5S5_BLUGR|nr:hypothetical protein BGT96224_5487 [Blumeria graminis f. sp. tritici 96224]CAD6499084.1 BgTH12-04736 [Blumeria graminis f. sp. triticale]VCU39219.1 Bgt-5487 [Blumeria graminis f. sp. tritici]